MVSELHTSPELEQEGTLLPWNETSAQPAACSIAGKVRMRVRIVLAMILGLRALLGGAARKSGVRLARRLEEARHGGPVTGMASIV